MELNVENVQNLIFDVSALLHEFCAEMKCSDIKQIKPDALKHIESENLSVLLLSFGRCLQHCNTTIKSSSKKIDEL